jgi:anti-sigma B factor antagonist
MELDISRRTVGDYPVVAVSGEVDVSSAPALRSALEELLAAGSVTIVVDFREVGFLDSTGLGALVTARSAAVDAGGALPIVCEHERILKVFSITGLDGVFDIYPTVDDAVRTLSGAAATE